jgi:chromosome partitioning protein
LLAAHIWRLHLVQYPGIARLIGFPGAAMASRNIRGEAAYLKHMPEPRNGNLLMHVVSVYNNKGGVGKSTLTVGLAEFLASNRQKRVLVIDLDAQASSSNSLLGYRLLIEAIQGCRTIVELAGEAARTRRVVGKPADFFTARPATGARGAALERIEVLVPDKAGMIELEETLDPRSDATILRDFLKPALQDFDFVLIDMPGNVDRRSTMVVAGLVMSDFVLVPIEPNQISLNALPETFDLVHYARGIEGDGKPAVIGMVLNKTDRRTQQFRSKMPEILRAANSGELPPIFESLLPDTPKLATSTDETLDFRTLRERYDTYYDNVRKVARELEDRCDGRTPVPDSRATRFGPVIRGILNKFARRKPKSAATRQTVS